MWQILWDFTPAFRRRLLTRDLFAVANLIVLTVEMGGIMRSLLSVCLSVCLLVG